MRIIGGYHRGRKLKEPDLRAIRPTKDRVRESVFNIITGWLEDAVVMDAFAGSGAYGLEALSRGSGEVVFIDNERDCTETIISNAKMLGFYDKVTIINGDVPDEIKKISLVKKKFDIIFADPPYKKGLVKKTLIYINNYDILNAPGILVVEHHVDEMMPGGEGDITLFKQKTYKDIVISVFLKK